MKLALLSDIHGNIEALEACLEHAAAYGVDGHAFLGDLVGYGADPVAVVERVAAFAAAGAPVVRGNHDTAAAGDRSEEMNAIAEAAVDWTRDQLTQDQRDWLAGLPLLAQQESICFVHASAAAPERWTYILDTGGASRSVEATDAIYTFSGHVHGQALYYCGAGMRMMRFSPVAGIPIPVARHRRWLAIVGSAGQPRDGNTAACYAVFDSARAMLTFHRVPYDYRAAAAKIRAAGLPEFLAQRLEKGE
ncbi:MAG: metallophosphoesterase [Zoogloeaceae bacterium]|jgi:diadenosine tetraphosphatase ApaH/serine/threonine PP2A family protein phosphatase|nr:metallophosphoesterase [Zoogloeaceae bacterium]